jgi:hypothetical protein
LVSTTLVFFLFGISFWIFDVVPVYVRTKVHDILNYVFLTFYTFQIGRMVLK